MKRLARGLLLALTIILVLAGPVLAAYSQVFTVVNSAATTYTMLPMIATDNNTALVSGSLISATGLDTRVKYGGTAVSHMVTNDKTLFASGLNGSTTKTFNYVAGESALSSFDLITGYNGYVTTTDNTTLELSDNFTREESGYVDTGTAGRNIVYKPLAYSENISASGTYTVNILSASGQSEIIRPDSAGDLTQNSVQFPAATFHWDKVDEAVADDATTYVGTTADGAGRKIDLYNLSAPTNSVGYISGITVTGRFIRIGADDAPGVYLKIKTGGTEYASDVKLIGLAYENVTYTWATNPQTGVAWAWSDFAALQAGMDMLNDAPGFATTWNCTQLYVTINFDNDVVQRQVSATGISSGEVTPIVRGVANSPQWATGSTSVFTGGANSVINCGALYAAEADFWISLWFKPTVTIDPTSAGFKRLYGQYQDATHNNYAQFYSLGGYLDIRSYRGVDAEMVSTTTTWTAGTWYHILVSYSSATGGELRVNNVVEDSDANTNPVASGLDFIIGDRVAAGGSGFPGQIMNVIIGTDILTPAEKTALYNGIAPGDETSYYYIDEGTGTTIVDYGSSASNGTAGAAVTWTTSTYTAGNTGRLCDFTIQIGSSRWGKNLKGVSAPNSSHNWVWGSLATPYTDYIKVTISGTQRLWYQPNAIISGTTLPDRAPAGGNTGAITWGSNPAGVTVTLSPTYNTQTIGATSAGINPLITTTPTAPTGMYHDTAPETTYIFFAPFINVGLDAGGIPRQLFWIPLAFATAVWAFIAVLGKTKGKELMLASIAAEVVLLLWWMGGHGVVPGWVLFIFPIPAIVGVLRGNQFGWRG